MSSGTKAALRHASVTDATADNPECAGRAMNIDEAMARACADVPGLIRGTLALLPDGLLLGGVGEGSMFDHEPLVRSAARCWPSAASGTERSLPAFVEYVFVIDGELVVLEAGRSAQRLVLALLCTREVNIALTLTASRRAFARLEASVDLAALGADS
jgi:hypothetical protein